MSEMDDEWIYCAEEECTARIKNHAWGKVKSAWYESKTGDAWCPAHIPKWVSKWRAEVLRKSLKKEL